MSRCNNWIAKKCCHFCWPLGLSIKDDAKYQFNPDDHIKIEPKEEMTEISRTDSEDSEGKDLAIVSKYKKNDNNGQFILGFKEIKLGSQTGLENENQDDDIIKEIKNRKEMVNYTIKREMLNNDLNLSELGIEPTELKVNAGTNEAFVQENIDTNENTSVDTNR